MVTSDYHREQVSSELHLSSYLHMYLCSSLFLCIWCFHGLTQIHRQWLNFFNPLITGANATVLSLQMRCLLSTPSPACLWRVQKFMVLSDICFFQHAESVMNSLHLFFWELGRAEFTKYRCYPLLWRPVILTLNKWLSSCCKGYYPINGKCPIPHLLYLLEQPRLEWDLLSSGCIMLVLDVQYLIHNTSTYFWQERC